MALRRRMMVVRCRGMRTLKALVLLAMCATCGSSKPTTQTTSNNTTNPTPPTLPTKLDTPGTPAAADDHDPCSDTTAPSTTVVEEPLITLEDKSEPEFFPPAWKKVAVGQTVAFATTVIDQDLDETAVTATKLPASAKFDAITQ